MKDYVIEDDRDGGWETVTKKKSKSAEEKKKEEQEKEHTQFMYDQYLDQF